MARSSSAGAAIVHHWIDNFILRHKLCPYAAASLRTVEVFESWDRNPMPGALQLSREIAAAGSTSLSAANAPKCELEGHSTQPPLSNFMLLLHHRSFRRFAVYDAASTALAAQLRDGDAAHGLAFFHPSFPEHNAPQGTPSFPTDVYVARAPIALWHFLPVQQLQSIASSTAPAGDTGMPPCTPCPSRTHQTPPCTAVAQRNSAHLQRLGLSAVRASYQQAARPPRQ